VTDQGTQGEWSRKTKGMKPVALLLGDTISVDSSDLVFSCEPQLLLSLPLLEFAQGNAELCGLGTKIRPVGRRGFRSRFGHR